MKPGRVVVIGAGLAGLVAAWRLERRGFEVSVLEREERPGGRLRSESADGFRFDVADPVLASSELELRRFIDEVGLRDELLPLRPVVTAQVHGGRVSEIDVRSLSGVARIPGVRMHQALRLRRLPRLLRRYRSALEPGVPERAAALDDRSVADFARLYFGRSVLERFAGPLVATRTGADEKEASRALFARLCADPDSLRFGLPRAALGELASAAAERLSVRYGVRVTRIEAGRDGRLRLRLRSQGSAGGGRAHAREADGVVVACPAPEARQLAAPLLAPAERDFLSGVRYAPGLCLGVALRRPFSPHPKLVQVPAVESSPLASILLEPGVAGGRAPAGSGLAQLRARTEWSALRYDLADEEAGEELLDAFEEIYPGARSAVILTRLFRVARARPRFDVGHYRTLARFERVQRDLRGAGRALAFAGDYLVEPTWEGAVVSGARASQALAGLLEP